ncbi:AMP-binding protein [Streptomyces sp. SID14478]|uniref:AMP-binding protein n=1 Tax=Streptomyces sp. SID14478 TaxID=2706073 RepID=UPI0013DC5AA6|nr:AMP-binding protein [Streptomyces sp. SID14478]NEB73639.1 AMP-binding protein [Streptomyces sp. SID14478]
MTSEKGAMLYSAIAVHASERPDKTALSQGEHRLSYGELAAAADELAASLGELGVAPETVVVIDLPVGPATVAALAAVSKLGAAFTLLEPELPGSRKELIIADCGPVALVTESGVTPGPKPAPPLDERLVRRTSPAAYVGYTSGSTGVPKGVVIEAAALDNHVRRTIDWYDLKESDTRLFFSSIAFDLALEQIWTSMVVGCELVFRDATFVYAGADDFLYHCRRLGVSVLSLPTGVFNRFGADLSAAADHLAPRLRLVMAGGEAPTRAAVSAWARVGAAGTRVVNGYGPTETAVVVCYRDLLPGDAIAIGKPIDGVRFRLEPLPADGEASGLVVQGIAVGRGYLGEAAASAAFGVVEGEWSYRTGDVATARPDGGYDLHGRFDAQVKVNGGFRVELGEIVSQLQAVDHVLDAVVAPFDGTGSRLLAAWVRLDRTLAPLDGVEADLIRRLAEVLPEYMVPARLAVLDEFPLTSRGKVDRVALLEGLQNETEAGNPSDGEAASSDVRTQLRLAWRQVLGAPPADEQASFFAVGGNSIRAIELITQVHTRTGLQLRAAELYRTPQFDALARLLTDRDAGIPTAHHTTGTTLVTMRPGGDDRLWVFLPPLSGAVTRYAAMSRMLPDGDTVWAMETPPELSGKGMTALADGLANILLDEGADRFASICISGFSLGGVIGYEVANRLHDRCADKVRALLIDPPDPGAHRVSVHDAFDIFVRVGWSIAIPARQFIGEDGGFDLAAVTAAAKDAGTLARDADQQEIEDAWTVYESNARILDGLLLSPPDGMRVHLLQGDTGGEIDYARRGPTTTVDGDAPWTRGRAIGQWRDILPDTAVDRLPVDHFALMEAPNDVLVRDWLEALAQG